MKSEIRQLLREASGEAEQSKEETGNKAKAQYDRIQRLLGNDMFNHSAIIDKIWGAGEKEDAAKRSLFRKKLNRETYQGTTYEFNEEELSKIAQALLDTSSLIRKNLGKSKQ